MPTRVAPDAYKRRAKNPSWTYEWVFIMATGTSHRYTGDIAAMNQPVIDTLKLADNLKESGFPDRQAEGLARALGYALTEHVATKADLDTAIRLVRADIAALDKKFSSALDSKFSTLDAKGNDRDTRIDALDARIDALDAKIDALDKKFEAKFNSLQTQIRFAFAMLAALLALGLIDTVVPLIA